MRTNTSRSTPSWASATAYEPYVGRWSRRIAQAFLPWLAVAPGSRWLDVGCGAGALTQTVLAAEAPSHVTGVDSSHAYLAYARAQTHDNRVSFMVGDAQALPYANATFGAVVSGLVLNFVPHPERAAAEMARVVADNGTVAAYVWDYAGGMEFMRAFWDAAVALDPAAGNLDQGQRYPICRPEPLAELFRLAGLQSVEARAIDIPTVFRDFDDYWTPFLGGQGGAPSYIKTLPEEQRAALREHLRAHLPITGDGSIHLAARAWAVRGAR